MTVSAAFFFFFKLTVHCIFAASVALCGKRTAIYIAITRCRFARKNRNKILTKKMASSHSMLAAPGKPDQPNFEVDLLTLRPEINHEDRPDSE